MILLSNSATQTIQPGDSIVFDLEKLHTGCSECHRAGSTSIKLRKSGIYELHFNGNICGYAVGTVELQMKAGGEILPETSMIVTENTVGSLTNVSATTLYKNYCDDFDRITITNTGTIAIIVDANSAFFAKRVA